MSFLVGLHLVGMFRRLEFGWLAIRLWEELSCYADGSFIVVWLVPGMWAVVFNMCCFIRLLFVSG